MCTELLPDIINITGSLFSDVIHVLSNFPFDLQNQPVIPVTRPSSPIWASTFVLMGMKQPEVIGKHPSGRGCARVPLCGGIPGGGDSRHSGKAAGGVATFPCCDLLAGARPPHRRPVQHNNRKRCRCVETNAAPPTAPPPADRQLPACEIGVSAAQWRAADAPPAGLSDVSGLRLNAQQDLKM